MSTPCVSGREKPPGQIIVVLQGEQAVWLTWFDDRIVDTRVERLHVDSPGLPVRDAWDHMLPGESIGRIRLVLDSCLDEVDRVRVDTLRAGWTGLLQRRRLRRQLRKEYPQATIHRLPGHAMPDVFSLVHHIIPPSWERWLMHLQDQGVYITHVATSLELLCQCAREGLIEQQGTTRAGVVDVRGARLICMPVGEERRHLLVDDGVPLFMRVAPVVAESPAFPVDSALAQSLRHIREHLAGNEVPLPILMPVGSISGSADKHGEARLLAAISMGNRIGLHPLVGSDDGETSGSIGEPLHCLPQPVNDEPSGRVGAVAALLARRWRRRASDRLWHLSSRRRMYSEILQRSIARDQQVRRIAQLRNATVLGALLAAVTLVFAAAHGFGVARERAQLAAESRQLNQHIVRLADDVNALNDHPDFVMRSIERIERHENTRPLRPQQVLATVAQAVNEFPSLTLDSLSWSVLNEEDSLDTVFVSAGQVASRNRIWGADLEPNSLQLELAGSVISELPLRERQQALESFVLHLRAMPGITRVKVQESPVNATRSSDHLKRDDAGYRLSLLLGAS